MKLKKNSLSSGLIVDVAIIKQQNGFTLIEVLIAMTIFAIGILAVASMQVTAITGNSFSCNLTGATTLAGDRMDALMSLDYNNHPDLSDTDGDGLAGLDHATGVTADHNRTYTGETNVVYNVFWNVADNVPVTDTKTVRMIVTWREKLTQKQISMDFIKAD